jgi:hypothetical protein
LEPSAYSESQAGTNIAVIADGMSRGDLTFDPALPIENTTPTISAASVG